ncbi:YbbR-like domain-containing protein [Tepidibacter hydrothermalis]|uniref:CdaR family protein n=1 Tax=Tepidibacter hydrothermalis TaxID=3036126 RepID=A0ABY8EBC4_9FIRM|nr:CdaR family protein [Tepidibacter hydrothermalis]WFD10096.1 CdaR family protein [Tepidibacter hydrothermalis]
MIDIFKRNLKIKTISTFFAFFMWIYVMAEVDPIILKDYDQIPIKINNVDILQENDMVLYPEPELNAKVILRGRRSLLKEIRKNDLEINTNLKSPKIGVNKLELDLDVPSNITYTIMPSNISLNVEESIYTKKEIAIKTTNTSNKDLKVDQINYSPKSTFVEGPKSLVENVDKLICKVDLKNKSKNFNSKAQIIPVDKNGKTVEGVNIKDQYTYVDIGFTKSKKIPLILNLKGEIGEGYKLLGYELNSKTVNITGKIEQIDAIKDIYTQEIDISDLTENKNINLNINIPQDIESDIKSVNVSFKVAKLVSKNLTISSKRIEYKDNIHNLDISKNNLPEDINVKVTYLEGNGRDVSEKDVQIFVNMQDEQVEPSKFRIKYNVLKEVESVHIDPEYVVIGE